MAAAANTTNNDDVHSTTYFSAGNAGSFRMDYTTPCNVGLYGGDVGDCNNARNDVKNVRGNVFDGKGDDQQRTEISLDDSLLFHLELPIPVDEDMVPTLYERGGASGHKDGEYDCGSLHARNVDCPSPEYEDDPTSYRNWTLRPTTPLPSQTEFNTCAAKSPQDITPTDQFPGNMPMGVISALKEALNGESYDSWRKSAKSKMKSMFDEAQCRDRRLRFIHEYERSGAAARDRALCAAERKYRDRTEGTWEETERRGKDRRRRRASTTATTTGKRHASE